MRLERVFQQNLKKRLLKSLSVLDLFDTVDRIYGEPGAECLWMTSHNKADLTVVWVVALWVVEETGGGLDSLG